MKKTEDKVEINDGHYHEMMDRLYVQMDILDQYLLKHPIGEKHKEISKPIIKAIVSLVQAYQITGGLAHDKINKTKKKETNKRRNSKDDNK
jgi:hypothetical protein